MLRSAMVLALAALAACGGDDDGPAVCETPDPEAECTDRYRFEAFVTDLATSSPVFDVSVGSTTTAPNGRAVLCLPDGDHQLTTSGEGFVPRIDILTSCPAATAISTGEGFPIKLLSDELLTTLDGDPDEDATHVMVTARLYPGGDQVLDATVNLDVAHEEVVQFGDSWLFLNVQGDEAAIDLVTGADCAGPGTLPLSTGSVVAAFFACE